MKKPTRQSALLFSKFEALVTEETTDAPPEPLVHIASRSQTNGARRPAC